MFLEARIPLLSVRALPACYPAMVHATVSMETAQLILDPYQTFRPESVGIMNNDPLSQKSLIFDNQSVLELFRNIVGVRGFFRHG